jgi:hypothetical protein
MRHPYKSVLPGQHDALIKTFAEMLASGSNQALPVVEIEAAVSLLNDEKPRSALNRWQSFQRFNPELLSPAAQQVGEGETAAIVCK